MSLHKPTRILTESAACVTLAAVLSLFTLFRMPLGGSVTPFATLPVILIGMRHGAKWGIGGALAFSLTQVLFGMSDVMAIPVMNLGYLALCILLDYVLAFTLLGLAGAIAQRSKNRSAGITAGVLITGSGRLLCSFLSGIVVWGPFTPDGWHVAYYSLAYNAAWCLPDTLITLIALLMLSRVPALDVFRG